MLDFVPHYFEFAKAAWRFTSGDVGHIRRGYSLFFLAHIVMLEGASSLDIDKVARVAAFYLALDEVGGSAAARDVAARLVEQYRLFSAR